MFPVSHRSDVRRNIYCGPAAISSLTGVSAEWAAALIESARLKSRSYGSRKPKAAIVAGTSNYEVLDALEKITGKQCRRVEDLPLRNIRNTKQLRFLGEGPFLINTPGHYMVYHNGALFDTKYPNGVDAQSIRARRIERLWTVPTISLPKAKKLEEAKWPDKAPRRPVDQLQKQRAARRRYETRTRVIQAEADDGTTHQIEITDQNCDIYRWTINAPKGYRFRANDTRWMNDDSIRFLREEGSFLEKCEDDCYCHRDKA